MLTHLLDTSVYCQRLRPIPVPEVVERWKALGDQVLAISSICEAEVRFGLEKRNSPRLWQEFHSFLENRLVLLPVDQAVAQDFARMKAELEGRGEPRADFDLLIASTARVHKLTLATLNTRHFERIPGLEVESWA